MSNVSINLRLRPIRFAFLIRPDDQKHVLEINGRCPHYSKNSAVTFLVEEYDFL